MIRHRVDGVVAGNGHPARGADDVREYYRTILRQLDWPASGDDGRLFSTLGVTSCYDGEGVSTVAAELAVAAACGGDRRVLLVDGNLPRPSLADRFGVAPGPGLAEVLLEQQDVEQAVQTTNVPHLSLLPAGDPCGAIQRAYDSAQLAPVIESLRQAFDLVVFDLPPAGQTGAALGLARLVDGVLLVVESERVRWEVAQRTKHFLLGAEVRLVGVVLNKRRHHVPEWLYRTL